MPGWASTQSYTPPDPPVHEPVESSQADTDLLATSLRSQDFVPYFQPLIELRTGRLAGVEMLARCFHRTHGLLSPDFFIPRIEREGWLGELMLDLTRQAAPALHALPQRIPLSINVSPLQLRDPLLPDQIQAVAKVIGYDLPCLTLEITETAISINEPGCLKVARHLKDMGCRLSLDDFGTGYSSLLHLQALPFDEIKIDQRFIRSMLEQRDSSKIVSAVVGLGQSLGLHTVAEGIETAEQSAKLRWLGCDIGQGWLFGQSVPACALQDLLRGPLIPPQEAKHFKLHDGSLDSPAIRLAQLQAVYDGVPIGLAFLDKQLRYLNLNQRMAQMNNCTIEEHLGKTVSEVLPTLFPILEKYLQRALAGESLHDVEIALYTSKGEACVRWFSYQPAFDQMGEIVGLCIAVSNRALPRKEPVQYRVAEI